MSIIEIVFNSNFTILPEKEYLAEKGLNKRNPYKVQLVVIKLKVFPKSPCQNSDHANLQS